jgi:hypothetical protein
MNGVILAVFAGDNNNNKKAHPSFLKDGLRLNGILGLEHV